MISQLKPGRQCDLQIPASRKVARSDESHMRGFVECGRDSHFDELVQRSIDNAESVCQGAIDAVTNSASSSESAVSSDDVFSRLGGS